jgi:hypothetical protein
MVRLPTATFVLLMTAGLPLAAGEHMTMSIAPRHSFAPANLTIRVRMQPEAADRWLEIVADSGEFFRSSAIPLEGERSASTVLVEYRDVPSGEYAVLGIVRDGAGRERQRVQQTAVVLGPASEN